MQCTTRGHAHWLPCWHSSTCARLTTHWELRAAAIAILAGLTLLTMSKNQLSSEGIQSLTALTSLQRLFLSESDVGDSGAATLATLTRLTYLDLVKCKLGAAGMHSLAQLQACTGLRV